ncbi:MAG: signal peptidase I [Candidatus Omnitrophica bacterium]|nr:signal peptidase I [Candidatus Omnitrophota bacterium]MBI2174813.1 signal peptidase I [Candidatus Omnitrophota bacterium]
MTKPSLASRWQRWRSHLEEIAWAVAIALVIRTFIAAPFKIPSGSMRMTLLEGDRILVSKFIYHFREPSRGEIVVFRYPENPKRPFIKRLAAIGGDTIEIQEGKLLINGEFVKESEVLASMHYYNQGPFGQEGQKVTVPKDSYFVLGDNSASSHDSRFWGFVPRRYLIGKAVCIFWPIFRWRVLK